MLDITCHTADPAQVWPARLDRQPARTLAILHQLDASQWWSPALIRAAQFRQLHSLLAHAARHAPAHRRRLRAAGFDPARPLDAAAWARIPLLTRRDLQDHGPRFRATVVPPTHGDIIENASGGSTGIPVRTRTAAAAMATYAAALCREHIWHGRDASLPAARIRNLPEREAIDPANAPDGLAYPDYGPPLAWLFRTGPAYAFSYTRPLPDQVDFLARTGAASLTTLPSSLRLLLAHIRDHDIRLPALRAVQTTSEVVDPDLRKLCHDVLGCRIADLYSAAETGLMATQCPDHDHCHVAAENCLLEVLDDEGRPCGVGDTGRVVVTPLHNFAMPLIRYEIGDRAKVGPPCPCGRGLPVLAAIVGRTYDTLVLADGSRRALGAGYGLARIPAITEYQLAQTAIGAVEIRVVAARPLTPQEHAAAVDAIRSRTGPDVVLHLTTHGHLPRTAVGKLRAFVSELPQ